MNDKKPMTVSEALSYLRDAYGESYHYNTIYAWLSQGKLRGFKRGGQWRVEAAALDDFFCPKSDNKPIMVGES
jgi:excisionase family DNA binding protein